MPKTAKISARIEPDLKNQVDAILASVGLSQSDAVTLFYHQIVLYRGLPFEVKIPNEETIIAMRELKTPTSRKNLKHFSSVQDLMADLDS